VAKTIGSRRMSYRVAMRAPPAICLAHFLLQESFFCKKTTNKTITGDSVLQPAMAFHNLR
jgi:hypothetical protein